MLKLKQVGVSALVGAADIGAALVDNSNTLGTAGNGPFLNATDITHAGMFVAGIGLSWMNKYTDEADTLAIASLPLLEHSVYAAVRAYLVPTLPNIRGYGGGGRGSRGRGAPGVVVLKSASGGFVAGSTKTY